MEKKILLVDDNEFDRSILGKAIQGKCGLKTIEAENGSRCLEILQTEPIDLVLMDIVMPGTFGSDILQKIREKFSAIELPVIMVTSKTDASDVVGCLKSGANDYITKPVNFDVAASRIITHLRVAELARESAKLKEMSAITAMVTTYNHEINNPLSIAIACMGRPDLNENSTKEKIKDALWRIADITKRIRAITEKMEVEYEGYGSLSKMVKVK
jgi:DNA-binding response OmpR family regulator